MSNSTDFFRVHINNTDTFRELLLSSTYCSSFMSNNTDTFKDLQSNNTNFAVFISRNTDTLLPNNTDTFSEVISSNTETVTELLPNNTNFYSVHIKQYYHFPVPESYCQAILTFSRQATLTISDTKPFFFNFF